MIRKKAAAYHGVQNMKFAPKKAGVYGEPFAMPYAQSISLNAQVSSADQYADNRLVCRIPSDTGYEGEFGTTGQDPELEKMAGFAIEGANGLITGNITRYMRGALYYEHTEADDDGIESVVKTWLFGVEIGKGSKNHTTDKNGAELGAYAYPIRVYGEKAMSSDGKKEYLNDRGVGMIACIYSAWPEDADYVTFGDAVPVPKVAANPSPALGALTVTSAEGTATGKTKITVTPAKESGNSYKYMTAPSVTLPDYDAVCTDGYTVWDGVAEITATTGNKIMLVEVTVDGRARKGGTATVAAKAGV